MQEEALAIRRRVLGEEHPHTLGSAINLLVTLEQIPDWNAAGDLFRRHLSRLLKLDPNTLPANIRRWLPELQSRVARYAATKAEGD